MLALASAQDDFRENVNERGLDQYGAPAAPALDTFAPLPAVLLDAPFQPQADVDVSYTKHGPWVSVPSEGYSAVPVNANYDAPPSSGSYSSFPVYAPEPAAYPVYAPAYDTRYIPQPNGGYPVAAAPTTLFSTQNLFIASTATLTIWLLIATVTRVVLPMLHLSWAVKSVAALLGKFVPSQAEVVAKGRSLAEVSSVAGMVFEAIDKYNLLNE